MADKKQSMFLLTLQISKITLRVRFPCHVCCSLKTDGSEREITGEGELSNGQAILNITHTSDLHLPCKKEFATLDKKCTLLIYLKSSSGRIPAGSVALPLMRAEGRSTREISRIDKCPDKNAFIEYEITLEKVERAEERKDNTLTTAIGKESGLLKNQNSQKSIKLAKSQSPERHQEERNLARPLKNSQVESHFALRRIPSKREETRSSLFETYYSGERKVGESERVFALQREIESFKTKVMMLEGEVATKAQRVSESEKEVKQLQKKTEQLEIDIKSASSKVEYAERAAKELQGQIKLLKERAEEEKLSFENSIKRLEIRENSYKEQIKVVSEKLYASESEKQRMIYEKNLSSNEFEGREKKLRETFKEKEKKLLEERTAMLKKIDSLEKDAEKAKEEIAESKFKNTDSVQTVHELRIAMESIESEKERFRSETNDLKFELTKLKNEKRILEENLDSIGKFNQERRNFRKQLSDKDIQNSQLKDRITSLEAHLARTRAQAEELDKQLKEKTNSLRLLERDYNILAKENGILSGDINDKEVKMASLMEELQLEMKRSKFLEGTAADLEEQFETRQDALERELRESTSYRAVLEEEVEKLTAENECNSRQLAEQARELQQFEGMLEEKGEQISSLESQLIQLNGLNQQLQMEKLELAEEKRDLQQKILQLSEEAQEREKELSNRAISISHKWEENASQLEASLSEANERAKVLAHALKEREQQLAALKQNNQDLEKQLEAAFAHTEELISQQNSMNHEISALKQDVEEARREISDRDAVIESVRNSLEAAEKQNDSLERQLQNLRGDLQATLQSLSKLTNDLAKYREGSYETLDIITSNLKSTEAAALSLKIDQIHHSKASDLLRAIIERNKDTHKQLDQKEQRIKQLEDNLENLAEERDLKERGLLAAGEHLELLKRNTNEFTDELTSKNALIKQLSDTIRAKETEMEDAEAANNKKMLTLNAIITQKNREIAELKHKHDELEDSVQKLTIELRSATSDLKRVEKEKKNNEADQKSKLTVADSNLRSEMQRVNALEADKSFLEKDLRQERENLRKVMRELQGKCYEFDELQLKMDGQESIVAFKDAEIRKFREANSELKQLLDIICTLEMPIEHFSSPLSPRIEKFLAEPASKEGEILKPKVTLFYENLCSIFEKIQIIREASHDQASQSKAYVDLQLKLQELNKQREKESESKMGLLKAFDEQKQFTEALRKLLDELMKLMATLEKEKKASVFVISPIKEITKKMEDQSNSMLKGLTAIITKNKRQWDLANIRAKKTNFKKQES